MTLEEFREAVEEVLPDNSDGLIEPEHLRYLFNLLALLIAEGVDE